MASGYYTVKTHPADMDTKTEGDICSEIVSEVIHGVEQTGIRAGIIGEIGRSAPIRDNGRKVLRAAAMAQQYTGAPLNIHPAAKSRPEVSGCLEIIETLK